MPAPSELMIDQRTEPEVAAELLAYLCDTLHAPQLAYADPPVRITGGFETFIYGFRLSGAPPEYSCPLVLRVFRNEESIWRPAGGAQLARFEAAVHKALWTLGFPVPRVLMLDTNMQQIGAAFTVMERVSGRIMLDGFFGPRILQLPGVLARTHAALHDLDPTALIEAFIAEPPMAAWLSLDDELARQRANVTRLELDGLQQGLGWLAERRPPNPEHGVICHGDFHPLNILVDRGRVTGVIDWSGARIADAAYDVGATIALFSHGPVDLPAPLQPLIGWIRRRLIGQYVRTYRRARMIDLVAVRYYEALRCFSFLIEAGQQFCADAGRVARPEKPSAFRAPHTVRSIIARFKKITGVTLTLPPARKG